MATEEEMTRARELGWRPKEQFSGDPDRFVDADEFLRRGEEMLPLLKAHNRKLEENLSHQGQELSQVKQALSEAKEAIEELTKFNSSMTRAAAENARKELLAQLKEARENGDVETEFEVNEQLGELREAQREAKKTADDKESKKGADTSNQQPQLDPAFVSWQQENPWFGTDARKTNLAMGIAQKLRSDSENDALVGKPFYDRVLELMNEELGGGSASKVGGGSPTGSAGGKKGYNALSPEAKAACDRQAKKVVGENRAFKTIEAWREHYAEMVLGE